MSEISATIALTQRWIEKVIIGLNFCPFAKREFEKQRIRYTVYAGIDAPGALTVFLDELHYLDQNAEIETTLLIFEHGFGDFEDYLDLADTATALLEQGGYRGRYQLATFHPDYCFEGEAPDDPSNFTNRSPKPTLHVLREASIERVLKTYSDPGSIPENNVTKTRDLGNAKLIKWQSAD
ncbi:MAG: hypothetical protein ACI8Z9_000124 [Paraglaciecola sp.]|jgi:hypothetical protein